MSSKLERQRQYPVSYGGNQPRSSSISAQKQSYSSYEASTRNCNNPLNMTPKTETFEASPLTKQQNLLLQAQLRQTQSYGLAKTSHITPTRAENSPISILKAGNVEILSRTNKLKKWIENNSLTQSPYFESYRRNSLNQYNQPSASLSNSTSKINDSKFIIQLQSKLQDNESLSALSQKRGGVSDDTELQPEMNFKLDLIDLKCNSDDEDEERTASVVLTELDETTDRLRGYYLPVLQEKRDSKSEITITQDLSGLDNHKAQKVPIFMVRMNKGCFL